MSRRALKGRCDPSVARVARICLADGTVCANGVPGCDRLHPYDLVVSPKDKRELGREHLETARDDFDGGRQKDAVNALFYAAEAAVVALADAHGIETRKKHYLKADAATQLHRRGLLRDDFGPLLRQLNQARKDIWYEGDEPDFDDGLEDILADVETLVQEAEGTA